VLTKEKAEAAGAEAAAGVAVAHGSVVAVVGVVGE
jgi:hypothetical protein